MAAAAAVAMMADDCFSVAHNPIQSISTGFVNCVIRGTIDCGVRAQVRRMLLMAGRWCASFRTWPKVGDKICYLHN